MLRSPPRRSPSSAARALLLVAVACRTPSATAAGAPVDPAPVAVGPDAARADTPALQPRVIVMPSGSAYLVLRAGPSARDGAATCDVLYLGGADTAEGTRPQAEERLAATARELVAAFAPIIEVTVVERLSITALLGRPGEAGRLDRRWFTRDGTGWRADATERAATQVPRLAASVVRDPDEESSAREAAIAFISDAERADFDAAWAKTSALVKAAVSRADFERTLAQRPRSTADGEVYLSFAVPLDRFLPGAVVEAWLARETANGPVLETLALRLDDDMAWRVADVAQLLRKSARPGAPPRRPVSALGTARAPSP